MNRATLLMGTSIVLAGGAGVLGSIALSASSAQTPSPTTTITLSNGATGPTGPQGPAGTVECNPGYTFGNLVINAPGGQVTIQTCIKNS